MNPILILGGDGLLGKHLINEIRKEYGQTPVSVSRTGDSTINADVTIRAKLEEIINEINPSFVINLVAITNVDYCESHVEDSYRVHVDLCKNLAIFEARYGYKTVHLSTDQIYDKPDSLEDEEIPKNVYALTKQMGEYLLSKNTTILRTNFFGKSLTANRESFTDVMYNKAKDGESISLFDDVFFSPLSISSLVQYIIVTMKNWNPGVYNLGSNNGMSKAQFVLHFLKGLGFSDLDYKIISSREFKFSAFRPSDMTMNVKRFENAYSVNLPSLEQEISTVIKDYK